MLKSIKSLSWRKLGLTQQKNKQINHSSKWQMPSSCFNAPVSLLSYVGFVQGLSMTILWFSRTWNFTERMLFSEFVYSWRKNIFNYLGCLDFPKLRLSGVINTQRIKPKQQKQFWSIVGVWVRIEIFIMFKNIVDCQSFVRHWKESSEKKSPSLIEFIV